MPPWVSKVLPHASRLQSLHNLLPLLVRTRPHLESIHESELHAYETLDETHLLLPDHGLLLGC